jgi:hypothetical protein
VDFTLAGSTITFLAGSQPLSGDVLEAWYRYNGAGSSIPGAMTVANAIQSALRWATVITPGQTPSGSELQEGADTLRRMTDLWSTDKGNIFTTRIDLYTLIAGQQKQTIGLTGDLVGPRPQRIERANILFQGTPTVRRPMHLLTDAQWANKRFQAVSTIPLELYNDGGNPLSTLYFYPIPDVAYQIELYTWQALSGWVDPGDSLIVPPGYEEMIISNLAVRLALQFGKPVSQELAMLASQAKASIQSLNTPRLRLRTDPALRGRGRGGLYNWMSGERER